jgi:glycosyltransferase involved in cell wall biosynthesis
MSKETLISIALCTYNGERFLWEQLESLAGQTKRPDELIVIDDGSTDGTLSLLEKFAQTAPFKVLISVNTTTLGVTKNFEKALTQCEGDFLFLCDQDDIWDVDKIAQMVSFLEQNPSVNVVFSDAFLVNENAVSLQQRLWESVRLYASQLEQWKKGESIGLMLVGNRVAGCTMAIRRSFLQKILPFPTDIPDFLHDTWIAFVASMVDQIRFISTPLVNYRQHSAQQVGTRPKNLTALTLHQRLSRPHEEKLVPFQKQHLELNKLYQHLQRVVPKENKNLKIVAEKIHFLSVRASLPNNRLLRISPIVKQWFKGNYHRFADQDTTSTGIFLTALGDVLE